MSKSIRYTDRFWAGYAGLAAEFIVVCFFIYEAIDGSLPWWASGLVIAFAIIVSLPIIPLVKNVRLRHQQLLIPRLGRSHRIPINDIAGIGLLFIGIPYRRGWAGFVWDTRGRRFQLARVKTSPRAFKGMNAMKYSEIRGTKAGTCIEELYRRVLAGQGPTGPLAHYQLQKHDSRRQIEGWMSIGVNGVGYWSPDGHMGPLGGANSSTRNKQIRH